MVGCSEADDFDSRTGAKGNTDRQHASADRGFAGAVLDERALRDFRATQDPREDFRECVPEVTQRRKNGKLVR